MWVFNTKGFFSIVEDKRNRNFLYVRARVRDDLERMLPGAKIQETPERDYRFRCRVTKRHFETVMANEVEDINYPNFKNAVAERLGRERSKPLHSVWHTMYQLQRADDRPKVACPGFGALHAIGECGCA